MKSKSLLTVVGTRGEAEALVAALVYEGFASDDLSVLVPTDEATACIDEHEVRESVLGLLRGADQFALAGVGRVVGAGPLMPLLATTASAVAAMVQLGLSEDEARDFETDLLGGAVLVAVQAGGPSQEDAARRVMDPGLRSLSHWQAWPLRVLH